MNKKYSSITLAGVITPKIWSNSSYIEADMSYDDTVIHHTCKWRKVFKFSYKGQYSNFHDNFTKFDRNADFAYLLKYVLRVPRSVLFLYTMKLGNFYQLLPWTRCLTLLNSTAMHLKVQKVNDAGYDHHEVQ